MDEKELFTFADKLLKQNAIGIDYENLTPSELAEEFEEKAKAVDRKITQDRNIAINSIFNSFDGYLD